MRQSFSGLFSSGWSYDITATRNNRPRGVNTWLSCIEKLPEMHERLQDVQIECKDFSDILTIYNTKDYLAYIDPPYVNNSRVSIKCYNCEMTNEEHTKLIEILLGYKGMIILSGYKNDIYLPLQQNGWVIKTHNTSVKASHPIAKKSKPKRTEYLWLNPQVIEALDVSQRQFL